MILSFEAKITETHLLWAVYAYTKRLGAPRDSDDVIKWLQGVILREGTKGFQATIEKWKKEIPDDTTYAFAELYVYETWGENAD